MAREPMKIYKEGTWFYVGKDSEFLRTRTGAGLRGFLNARKLIMKRSSQKTIPIRRIR